MKIKLLTATILSMSLLTVMAGAAVAPALSIIKHHFADSPDLLVQFIISLPAFFIIIANLCFPLLCRVLRVRTIALTGLVLYVVCGTMPYLLGNIYAILVFRALLGISVGIIMPLSTGLLAFYFPPQQQASLMGLSAAMNQMGGVVATLLAGLLANTGWNNAFLVYLLGLVAVVAVALFLPNERLTTHRSANTASFGARLRHFHPSVVGMFLCMSLFFVFPSNFAITTSVQTSLSTNAITAIMVGLDMVAFFVGLAFGGLMRSFRTSIKYFAPILFLLGYVCYAVSPSIMMISLGCVFIGLANGIGVPYLNTIASIKGGHDAATTVMPLISASLYLGQFLSPIYISSLGKSVFGSSILAPYHMAIAIAVVYLIQTYCTRNFQALPPQEHV